MTFGLTSTAFADGQPIPRRHTGEGEDLSPPLAWTGAPAGTRAFALIADDPDAPSGDWVHWVLYDIPPETAGLDEGIPAAPRVLGTARHGSTDNGTPGYGGPMPPRGRPHRYFFKLYALDREIGQPPGLTKRQLLRAMQGHVLAEAQLMGTYQR